MFYQAREGSDEKNGPNDTRHVVWAKGMFFFINIYILTNNFIIFRFDLSIKRIGRVVLGSKDNNRPQVHNYSVLNSVTIFLPCNKTLTSEDTAKLLWKTYTNNLDFRTRLSPIEDHSLHQRPSKNF